MSVSSGTLSAVVAILAYCGSSMSLTLVNKLAIVYFPYPNLLLVFQNGITTLLILGLNYTPWFSGKVSISINCKTHSRVLQVNPLEKDKVKKWVWVVFLFMGLLLSSLMALKYVTVVHYTSSLPVSSD